MRRAAILTMFFGGLALTTAILGISGLLDQAPVLWRTGWPVAVVMQTLLAAVFGFYASKTGGLRE